MQCADQATHMPEEERSPYIIALASGRVHLGVCSEGGLDFAINCQPANCGQETIAGHFQLQQHE